MIEIKSLLKKYNIRPNKFMGQNFLIDENVLNKIIEAANPKKDDTILEVGPGLGILTVELTKRTKRVIAIEKDKNLCGILQKILDAENIKNVEIIQGDILKISNLEFLISKQIPNPNYKIVANIPYYLTSPLIRKFLEANNQPEFMVLMVQKEVAERITAKPPHMSILSVAVQFYANPEIISVISKDSFCPTPKVDSAIIRIVPKKIPDIDTKRFFGLVKKGFSSKRKMLKNNIPEINLGKIGLNPSIRAENLSIDDWINLFHSSKLS